MRKASFAVLVLSVVLLAAAVPLQAQGGTATTRLRSFDEVPATATPGAGIFSATINEDGTEMEWQLNYFNIEGNVLQAHLHFAQKGVNGGIFIFLCTNLGNGPVGTQACPPKSGTIGGTVTAADVLPLPGQSFSAGDLASVLRAIRAGIVYANVHTDQLPGGSIRGQLSFTPSD